MEENKFEKQVQQKMDELKIQPSEGVWKKIEVRIEKKKRSRWELLLLFLLLCFFISGGYWLWNTGQHSVSKHSNSIKNNSEKNGDIITSNKNKTLHSEINSIPGSVNQNNNEEENTAVENKSNKNLSHHQKFLSHKKINIEINSGEKVSVIFSKQQEIKDEISQNTSAKQEIVQLQEIHPQYKENAINDSASHKLNSDSLLNQTSFRDKISKENDTSKQISVTSKTVKSSNKNKWKTGILFTVGISGVGNDFLGLVNSPADFQSSSAPGTTIPATSSRTISGFGFIVGVFAEKNISSKIKFVPGINFKSFRTTNKVGASNAATGNYNTQNPVNRYNSYYNFIELPLLVKIQIGNGKSFPLFWQGGFVISELISSNGLQFNQNSGLYYSDNSIFNKTQIGLNTSISTAIFSKQKMSILIGPYFYYGASKIANEGLYNKKYFVFTGLHTEVIF